MDYLKRLAMPKSWPLPRKKGIGKYITKPKASLERSVTLLVILRDILKIAKIRKEIKKIVHEGEILVNSKKASNERLPVQIFDTIGIPKIKKFYRLNLSKSGRLIVEEINETESHKKICKIVGKNTLKKKKLQLNLNDGRNFFSNEGHVNDSVVIDLKQNKIIKILHLKEKANVRIINGKMTGTEGIISKIQGEGKKRIIQIISGKRTIKSTPENMLVIE
ncbi:30S ribosomal protein S4e [Candidatus Pacearchaeota archaeon]|nr:30S ribosomal protein S4e [Candidatus Pacearchaeota archaeon]